MVQRNYQEGTPTLRPESTVRGENLSGESQGEREDFRPEESEDDAEARQNYGLFKEISLIVIILNREFNLRAKMMNFHLCFMLSAFSLCLCNCRSQQSAQCRYQSTK